MNESSEIYCTCKQPNSECFRGQLIMLPKEKRDILIDIGLRDVMFSTPKT